MIVIFAFIILIAVLILVHEFGHFLAARCFGVGVEVFSIGLGKKKIASFKKNETTYCISAIPLGGYVKLQGEPFSTIVSQQNPDRDPSKDLTGKPIWQKAVILMSGTLFNLILAWVIFVILGATVGEPTLKIDTAYEDRPAAMAGMQSGDVVTQIDGLKVKNWNEFVGAIQRSAGNQISITVLRESQTVNLTVQPEKIMDLSALTDRYLIGVQSAIETSSFLASIAKGAEKVWLITRMTVLTLSKMVIGQESVKALSGPVRIAQMSSAAAQKGPVAFFALMGVLSITIGVLNLLPIPILDGGLLMLLAYEAIRGKAPSHKAINISQRAGYFAVSLIMGVALYNDFAKMF